MDVQEIQNKDLTTVTISLVGATPATAANYGVFYIADKGVELVRLKVTWGVASTSGTLDLERLQGTEALDAGDSLLATVIATSGTANTVATKDGLDFNNTIRETVLSPGDRLALVDAGTLDNLVDLCVTIWLRPVGKGHYQV